MKQKTIKTIKKYGFIWSILIYPTILFLIFYVAVNINSIILAFQKIDYQTGQAEFAGFANFIRFGELVAGDALFQTSIINSLKMYVINFVISVPLMILFSFYIYKKMPMSAVFRLLVMIPSIISSFIMCMLFQKLVENGLPDLFRNLFGIEFPKLLSDERYTFGTCLFYMIWISFSTSLLVMPNAMKEIPEEVIESAQLDGVSHLKELWYIVIPLIMPTLSTFIVTGISGIFSNVGPVHMFYMYDAFPEVYNVGYYLLRMTLIAETSASYPFLSAAGIVFTLIIAPLTFLVKWLLERKFTND